MAARILFVALLLCVAAAPAIPHSGGTNAAGCHTDHRTGDYHCHTPKTPPSGADTYCHVVQGDRRCGYSYSGCQNLVAEFGGYCRKE